MISPGSYLPFVPSCFFFLSRVASLLASYSSYFFLLFFVLLLPLFSFLLIFFFVYSMLLLLLILFYAFLFGSVVASLFSPRAEYTGTTGPVPQSPTHCRAKRLPSVPKSYAAGMATPPPSRDGTLLVPR